MKKYIARNSNAQKAFCTYEMMNTGILRVNYFLPRAGFSVIWNRKDNLCRIAEANPTSDGRKTIVSFLIHPNYWTGYGFKEYYFDTIFQAMNRCFIDNIKLL
jgi:hypothetical protein